MKANVVFIEDSPEDADLAIRLLKKNNSVSEVKLLDDGQKALDYFFGDENSHTWQVTSSCVILLDLKLPKVSGLEILEKIKSAPDLKCIPVVVMTSSREDIDIQRAYALGANSYIVKPVQFGDFEDTICQLGAYWLALNQPLNSLSC